jgi:hypothetical protein
LILNENLSFAKASFVQDRGALENFYAGMTETLWPQSRAVTIPNRSGAFIER